MRAMAYVRSFLLPSYPIIANQRLHPRIAPIALFVIIFDLCPTLAYALTYQGQPTPQIQQGKTFASFSHYPELQTPPTLALAPFQLAAESKTNEPAVKGDRDEQGASAKGNEKSEEKRSSSGTQEEINWLIDNPSRQIRQQEFSILLAFGPNYDRNRSLGANVGGLLWYTLPILHKGLIPTINNAFSAEFGGFVGVGPLGNSAYAGPLLSAAGGVRWDFYLTEMWRLFATLKLGMTVWEEGFLGIDSNGILIRWPLYPNLSLGSLFRINESVLIRLDIDFPRGLIAGITFAF